LIMSDGGKKLSKSAGDTSIKYLRENGVNLKELYQKLNFSKD
jgi:hypothetical protein